jgi:Fe2+ transport system protein FeoA
MSDFQNIYQAKNNRYYIIESVPETPLLLSLGIEPNVRVYKKYSYRLGGPVIIDVDMCRVAIGKDIARQIIVKEVN